MLTKDVGICIRAVDYSETSQVVTFFTRDHGKVAAIAKGSKRPKSAVGGPIEVLAVGPLMFTDSHRDGMATLTEFEQQPLGAGPAHDLFTLNCGLFAAELVDKLTHDYDSHPDLFDQFREFLQNMQVRPATPVEPRDITILLIVFQLGLLKEVGLRPALAACTNCKRTFDTTWAQSYFSSSANGFVCEDCDAGFPDKVRLTPDAVQVLANLKRLPQCSMQVLDEIERVLISHLTGILGRPPRMARHIVPQRRIPPASRPR